MAFQAVPNVIQIELVYQLGSQIMENVLHYGYDTTPSVDDLGNLGHAVGAIWDAELSAQLTTGISITKVKCTDLGSETAGVSEFGGEVGWVGLNASEALPFNCAALLSLRTGSRGRSYRGRIYIPGMTENNQSFSAWTNDVMVVLQTFADALLVVAVDTIEYSLCVVSRFHNGTPRATGIKTPVVTIQAVKEVASMRRRLPGRGA